MVISQLVESFNFFYFNHKYLRVDLKSKNYIIKRWQIF